MSAWRVLMKCRRCGAIDRSLGGDDKIVKMSVLEAVYSKSGSSRVELGHIVCRIGVHTCADGADGVTDLIGCEPEPQP